MSQDFNKKISIVGAGNVAYHLCKALIRAGVVPQQLYARSKSKVAIFEQMGIEVIDDPVKFRAAAVYILAVNDDAITDAAKLLPGDAAIVVHTSGSVAAEILEGFAVAYGVFYPLQTFSFKREVDFTAIPVFIQASDETTRLKLENLARMLSKEVYSTNNADRKLLHLAAVFVSNFSNALYGIASDLLTDHQIPFHHLYPLILETAEKSLVVDPLAGQTGPARRNDQETLAAHLKMLDANADEQEIYDLLTNYIINKYHSKQK
ncbi:MAG: DUF2520 domain-containing protein [Bacteroidetes bacterium]|nr:DUF2520 domain-containing protein [Bacteroidota bacterium]